MPRMSIIGLFVLSFWSVGCRCYDMRNTPRPRPIEISVTASYQYEDGAVSVTIRK